MSLSTNSTLAELLEDPKACKAVDKYVPGFQKNPLIDMAKGLTLREIQEKSGGLLHAEYLDALDKDLAALG